MKSIKNMIDEMSLIGVPYRPIKEIATCYPGATPKTSRPEYWENGTIPWMSSGEVNKGVIYETEQRITQLGYDSSSTKMVPPNSVVIALAGQGKTRGTVAITRIELCTNQSLCAIVPGPEMRPEFLLHFLKSRYKDLRHISSGNGERGGLNVQMIKEYLAPVPPVEIQDEIVCILDEYYAKNNQLITALNNELASRQRQYEYYRDLLLTFDDASATIAGQTDRQTDRQRRIAVEWLTMEQALDLKAGKNIPASEISPVKTIEKSVPCFGGNNVRGYVKSPNRHGTYPVIGRQGALCGNVCLATGDFYATEHAVVVGMKESFDEEFLYYLLVKMNLNQYKTVGAQPGLSVERLNKIKIPVPPIALQQQIAKQLTAYSSSYEQLVSSIKHEMEARVEQFSFYRDKLLAFNEVA